MDIESWRGILEQASMASLGVGFLLGFLFSFNPVALASIPVSLAYVTKAREPKKAVLYGGMFILGMVVAQGALGLIAGLGGQWAEKIIGRQWGLVLGPLLILLGLLWPGWLRLPLPSIAMRAKRVESGLGAFALGRAVPILLGALTVGWLESLSGLRKYRKVFEMVGGVLLILSGLYMLNAYFFFVPELAG